MLIKTFGFVGNAGMPSILRVELRVERGFLFRLSGVNTSAAKALQARVRSDLIACGYRWPGKGITVNVAPAAQTRSNTQLDLPIALAILAAEGQIPKHSIQHTAFSGELSLDGTIHSVSSPAAFSVANPATLTDSISHEELNKIELIFNTTNN